MDKVKLIIELDEEFYKYVCEEIKSDELVYKAIQNGTPLEEEGYITTIERHKENMPYYPFD